MEEKIQAAKDWIKDNIPEMHDAELSSCELHEPVSAKSIAHKLDLEGHNFDEQPDSNHVVKMRKQFVAEDGTVLNKIVSVTVDQNNNVLRGTISK